MAVVIILNVLMQHGIHLQEKTVLIVIIYWLQKIRMLYVKNAVILNNRFFKIFF